jgi:Fe-S cluster assembly scaffold protein SufB
VLETITTPQMGLTRQAVEELSRRRREPDWLLRLRLEAFEAYEQAPLPDQRTEGWRRTSLAGLDLVNQTPLVSRAGKGGSGRAGDGKQASSPLPHSSTPPLGVLVQQDGTTVQTRLAPELAERGVVLLGLAEAVRDPALASAVALKTVRPRLRTTTSRPAARVTTALIVAPLRVSRMLRIATPSRSVAAGGR